jgi:hypothetical protein
MVSGTSTAEGLRAGTPLVERLKNAHETYQRLGWTVSELRPGAWGLTAERAERRLLMAVRAGLLVTAAATSTAAIVLIRSQAQVTSQNAAGHSAAGRSHFTELRLRRNLGEADLRETSFA